MSLHPSTTEFRPLGGVMPASALLAVAILASLLPAPGCALGQRADKPADAAHAGEYARAEALVRSHQWDEGLAVLEPLLKSRLDAERFFSRKTLGQRKPWLYKVGIKMHAWA